MNRQTRTPSNVYTHILVLSIFNNIIHRQARPVLPSSHVGVVRGPPDHPWEIVVRETLRIVRVLRPVVADKVVCQLMAERDPPVRHGLHQTIGTVHAASMQLLKVPEVAEDAAVLVESDGGTLLVGENVES